MSAAAQKTASAKAKKAQLASPKGKKGGPSKGAKRVGKKVTVAVIKRKSTVAPPASSTSAGLPRCPSATFEAPSR